MGKKRPPEPREEPLDEANAVAEAMTVGSEAACSARTECRIDRNLGFSLKVEGVGGLLGEVPIARAGVGGVVGRRVRRVEERVRSSGKVY